MRTQPPLPQQHSSRRLMPWTALARSPAALVGTVLLGAAAVGAGCSGYLPGEEGEEEIGEVSESLVDTGKVCVTLRRTGSSGVAADATIYKNTPAYNEPAYTTISSGTSANTGPRRALLRFDLSSIPANATVVSSTLRLVQSSKGGATSTVSVYRATQAWTETTVTWSSFGSGGSYSPTAVTSFQAPTGSAVHNLNLTGLVDSWVAGDVPNHGIVLSEPSVVRTSIKSSENSTPADRPGLTVCYVTCSDGVQNGDETGVDCGGSTCAPCGGGLPIESTAPATLSGTGLYANIATHQIASYAKEFQPVYPLWSDGAAKRRFVYLPPGSTIDTSDMDEWYLPIGTRLWKEFKVGGAPVETRYSHRFGPGVDDWVFATYQWEPGGGEAYLVEGGVNNANGTAHDIPRSSDCWTCHGSLPERTLGFSALQLSHSGPGETMASLSAAGRLSVPLPGGVYPPGNATAKAALGYLHSNCGNCHNSTGMATLRLRLLTSDATVEDTDAYTTAVEVASNFSVPGMTYRIAPGNPSASVLTHRMHQRGSMAQMPPLGTEMVDATGTDAVEDWIATLTPRAPDGPSNPGGSSSSSSSSSSSTSSSSTSASSSSASSSSSSGSGGSGGSGGAGGSSSSSSSTSSSSSSSSTSGAGGGGPGSPSCNGVPPLKLTRVATGLAAPVFAVSPPGDSSRLFILEKNGVVRLLKNGVLQATPFLDIRGGLACPPSSAGSANPLVCIPSANSEGGLLGMAFHPGYAQNGRFFLFYTASPSGRATVAEFRRSSVNPDIADLGAGRVPVKKLIDVSHGGWNHVGGMIAFGSDGHLYAGIGDGAMSPVSSSPAKDLSSALGKILRVNVDTGLGPAGNMTGTNVNPLIWDYGLRNPWRFSFDRQNGNLYIGDVGQNAWEEINVEASLTGQRNYGWPTMEAAHCLTSGCTPVGTMPVVERGHASGEATSIVGGYVYRGSAIPCLQGYYLYGDYGTHRYWAMRWNGSAATEHTEITANLSASTLPLVSFGENAAGEMFLVMINGEVYRLDAE